MFPDIFETLKRGPQIITLKDCALISAYAGIGGGDVVLDAGTGSGFLAIYLGNIVKPNGRVISYENKKKFFKLATRNIEKAALQEIVNVKQKDIYKGIDEKDLDAIILDLPEPWRVVEHAFRSLKNGHYLVSYSPTIEQTKRFVEECKKFSMQTKTLESIVREILVRENATRPQIKGLMHTGYITFAKKVIECVRPKQV